MDKQVDVVLRVSLGTSILHVDKPYPHGEICVSYKKLLTKHLETDGVLLGEADDYLIQLERAHLLHCQLPVCHLIYT